MMREAREAEEVKEIKEVKEIQDRNYGPLRLPPTLSKAPVAS
jgi:hypothetical protein